MRKMYSKKQIEEIAKSSVVSGGGKVYLHNIYIDAGKKGYMKLYTTNNEPFTKDTLATFMVSNGITSRVKGFPLAYDSIVANSDNRPKLLNTNFVAYAENNELKISAESIIFNIIDNTVNLVVNPDNFNFANTITDTVIEL